MCSPTQDGRGRGGETGGLKGRCEKVLHPGRLHTQFCRLQGATESWQAAGWQKGLGTEWAAGQRAPRAGPGRRAAGACLGRATGGRGGTPSLCGAPHRGCGVEAGEEVWAAAGRLGRGGCLRRGLAANTLRVLTFPPRQTGLENWRPVTRTGCWGQALTPKQSTDWHSFGV